MVSKTASMSFGRFNPPTLSHLHVFKTCEKYGHPWVFASHSQDKHKNPLSYDEKIEIFKKLNSSINFGHKNVRDIIQACKYLNQEKYNNLVYIAGGDRIDEFGKILEKYNGKEYQFDSIKIICAGARHGSTKIENISGTLLRKYVLIDDRENFKKSFIIPEYSDETFDLLKERMKQ